MAISFLINYHLSARGKREALKAGLDPTDVRSYQLDPGDPCYEGFADLVDISSIEENEFAGQYISHTVGAAYGFKVFIWDFDSSGLDFFDTHLKEVADPATQVYFDHPMGIEELLKFDQSHQAKKLEARHAAEQILAKQLERERLSELDSEAKNRAAAMQWLEDNAHWGQLQNYKVLKSALEKGEDIGSRFTEGSHWRRAIDTVSLHTEMKEAVPWIKNHGSKRLKRILKENLLHTSMSVYRDERLSAEHPNWEWLRKYLYRLEEPRNPTEGMLDRLDEARLDFPDCKLQWDRDSKTSVILATFLGKQVRYKQPAYSDDDIPF